MFLPQHHQRHFLHRVWNLSLRSHHPHGEAELQSYQLVLSVCQRSAVSVVECCQKVQLVLLSVCQKVLLVLSVCQRSAVSVVECLPKSAVSVECLPKVLLVLSVCQKCC